MPFLGFVGCWLLPPRRRRPEPPGIVGRGHHSASHRAGGEPAAGREMILFYWHRRSNRQNQTLKAKVPTMSMAASILSMSFPSEFHVV